MPRRHPPEPGPRARGRVAGYGGSGRGGRPEPGSPVRRRTSRLAEAAVWLAATAVAGALLLLLARHDLTLALPVVVAYLGLSWLLWRTRR